MILLIILIFLITSYIAFIIVPAVLLYRFVFGRKPCSTPLNERGTLEVRGTRRFLRRCCLPRGSCSRVSTRA